MKELQELIDNYWNDYQVAPLYGSYSRTLRKRIPSKGDIQKAFIENIQMLAKVSIDPKVEEAVNKLLTKFE
tara:strand:+ start:161 stop:373 length:213 start_codon:yes stop_codon:yes gene_type:complete